MKEDGHALKKTGKHHGSDGPNQAGERKLDLRQVGEKRTPGP